MHASVSTMDVDLPDLAPQRIRRLSGREFDAMCAGGILEADEHVELLRGVLVTMSPQNEPHARVTSWLGAWLVRSLDDAFEVRQHTTFAPLDHSRPEPDIAVFRADRARTHLPAQALLVIEVSDSSLRIDRKVKVPLYGEAGLVEYWIIDINASAVEVYTGPTPTGYARAAIYRATDTLRPLALPGVTLPVAEIAFRPAGP